MLTHTKVKLMGRKESREIYFDIIHTTQHIQLTFDTMLMLYTLNLMNGLFRSLE